ncbi:hypothetical protein AB4144_58625, partial [Rhizobiaceae sp. 2RAB30]
LRPTGPDCGFIVAIHTPADEATRAGLAKLLDCSNGPDHGARQGQEAGGQDDELPVRISFPALRPGYAIAAVIASAGYAREAT